MRLGLASPSLTAFGFRVAGFGLRVSVSGLGLALLGCGYRSYRGWVVDLLVAVFPVALQQLPFYRLGCRGSGFGFRVYGSLTVSWASVRDSVREMGPLMAGLKFWAVDVLLFASKGLMAGF
jgi:hypothetical protein